MKQSFGTPTSTAEGDVLDVAGFVASFTEDDVFNNVAVANESYRGELPRRRRARHRPACSPMYTVETVSSERARRQSSPVELSIQGTFLGPLETPAGTIQPTVSAAIDVPTG